MPKHGTAAGVAGALILCVVTGCAGDDQAQTSRGGACAAPTIAVSETTVHPGDEIVVTGEYMFDGCDDYGRVATDASGHAHELPREPVLPLTGQGVGWKQGSNDTILAWADADENGFIEVLVRVPDGARVGAGEIRIGTAMPITVDVVRHR